MEYIKVTKDNIDQEHICCALSKKDDVQVISKKKWMKECFDDGLIFIKSKERGKCFIEYVPAQNAWIPIIAAEYMYINCLWVSGSLKGHGYANDLLDACIKDSKEKGMKGICILSSDKKKPFLADPKFLKHEGFIITDIADNGISLWCLPFEESTLPLFKECAKHLVIDEKGYVLYYTNQCPFNGKYVPLLEECAKQHGISFKAIKFTSKEEAQNAPTPITNYALFYDGHYITNEQMNEKKFLKLVNL